MFRVIGEVDAHVDGRRLDVGHARQRAVLACLLVDVNRPISADQLIDRVWADAPPQKARNALAAYISRLRRVLAAADETEIVRGPGGYILRADALAVDLHLFRHHVAQARKADGPVQAATIFDQALDIWRGEPIPAVDTPWANETRSSLESEHLSVTLDRNDAALATGRHAELLSDLVDTWQTHPLDERVAGQLMVAQYRNGRQAEALDTYRVMRERLVAELGVDPSPSLDAVHRQLLGGDRSRPAMRPATPPSSAVPRHPTRLIGRDDDVQRVLVALKAGPVVTLTGVGGVGKTRLALAAAADIAGSFADGVYVCELAPLGDGAAVGQTVAATLRLQPGRDLNPDDAVVDFLRPRQLLLVVDNCEHVLADAAQLIDRIGRHCPRVKFLATSREPLSVDAERVIPVSPLSELHAAELFVVRARASRPDFDPDHEPAGVVDEICRRLDGLPLAIELAAARMRAMSGRDLARRLDRLRLLSGGTRGAHPRQQSVTATIDWSYRLLSEPEQALFARLSVFAGGFDLDAAHAVCAEPGHAQDDTLDLLIALVDKSMVIVRPVGDSTRYGVLETLRTYGREVLQDKGAVDDVAARHARYYTEFVELAAAGIQGPDEQAWIQRIMPGPGGYSTPEYDNLRTAFEYAFAGGNFDLGLRLVTSLPELLFMRTGVHSGEWAARLVAVADPAHPLFTAAVGTAARAAWIVGRYTRARALANLAPIGVTGAPIPYCADPTDVLADTALYEGDPATALTHYEAQMTAARRSGDPRRLVWILYNITLAHAAKRTPAAGLAAAEEAMRVAEATAATNANPTTQSMALCALARAVAESDPDRAMALYDQAGTLAVSVTNNWLRGIACAEDAAIRAIHGDPAETAGILIELVEHWDLAGPGIGSYQWATLRDVTRLLVRLGSGDDALALHHALVAAGHEPPLSAAQLAQLGDSGEIPSKGMTDREAVQLATTTLRRYL
jgi:predicted ATPase/DNA-binding SARP family transcriptional activator